MAELLADAAKRQEKAILAGYRDAALVAAGGDDPTPPVDTDRFWNAELWEDTLAEAEVQVSKFIADELEGDFGISATSEQPMVKGMTARHVADIEAWADDYKAHVSRIVERGQRRQLSVRQVAQALEDAGLAKGRSAETIARTEMVAASNAAAFTGAKAISAPGDKKAWIASRDARVRDDHRRADGQEVGLDEEFRVGGERGEYPGDRSFSPAQRASCRCTFRIVLAAPDPKEGATGRGKPVHTPENEKAYQEAVTHGKVAIGDPARSPKFDALRRYQDRNDEMNKAAQDTGVVDPALAEMNKLARRRLPEPLQVYRGVPDEVAERHLATPRGEVVSIAAVDDEVIFSTTWPEYAAGFTGKRDGGVIYEIVAKRGLAIDDEWSWVTAEHAVLLSGSGRYRVIGRRTIAEVGESYNTRTNVTIIRLEEVD